MSDPSARRRVIAPILLCVAAMACWYLFVFSPQRQTLRDLLNRTSAETREIEAIHATLAQATAIRRARSQILARLSGENRSGRRAIEQSLVLLDRNARLQSVSILSIVPAGNMPSQSVSGSPADDGTELSISVEGTFEATMRFLEAASSSVEPLDIGDVRLNAERSDGNQERLLAQIDARVYHFTMPK
jgi:hypothetical protein